MLLIILILLTYYLLILVQSESMLKTRFTLFLEDITFLKKINLQ